MFTIRYFLCSSCLFILTCLASSFTSDYKSLYNDNSQTIQKVEQLADDYFQAQTLYDASQALVDVVESQLNAMLQPEANLDTAKLYLIVERKVRARKMHKEHHNRLLLIEAKLDSISIFKLRIASDYFSSVTKSLWTKFERANRRKQLHRMTMLREQIDVTSRNHHFVENRLNDRQQIFRASSFTPRFFDSFLSEVDSRRL